MVNRAKKESEENGTAYLRKVFCGVEDTLINNLNKEALESTHDATLGDNCEQHWINLLRDYLPARYGVSKTFVVDSTGKTSDALDVVIYDPQYTPTLYGRDSKQYLPREAIYAVFESKPSVNKQHLEYAGNKALSVQSMYCSSAPIVNAGKSFPPRDPFPVLTGLLAQSADWSGGLNANSFLTNLPSGEQNQLDFVLTAESGFYDGMNRSEPVIATGNGSLMRGLFRLLNALQQLGTVPAIDWSIYEDILS